MIRWILLVVVGLFPACDVAAKLPRVDLRDLVSFSDFIFIGRIHSRGDEVVLRGSFNTWGLLEIEVDHVICGGFFKEEWPDGRVEVLFPMNPMERPSFDPGARYLFFWKDGHSGPQLAPSFYGASLIEGGLVNMQLIDDIARSVPVDELEAMIDCNLATGSGQIPAR